MGLPDCRALNHKACRKQQNVPDCHTALQLCACHRSVRTDFFFSAVFCYFSIFEKETQQSLETFPQMMRSRKL